MPTVDSFDLLCSVPCAEVTLHAKLEENNITGKEAHDEATVIYGQVENQVLREGRKKVSIEDFELLKVRQGAELVSPS